MPAIKVLPKGQITLPKKVREHLGIHVGDALVIEEKKDSIILKKGKTIYDIIGTLPAPAIPIAEMIEKATEEAMKDRA
jgi:AbrB family looped-hinge helix DNA binding protein